MMEFITFFQTEVFLIFDGLDLRVGTSDLKKKIFKNTNDFILALMNCGKERCCTRVSSGTTVVPTVKLSQC